MLSFIFSSFIGDHNNTYKNNSYESVTAKEESRLVDLKCVLGPVCAL